MNGNPETVINSIKEVVVIGNDTKFIKKLRRNPWEDFTMGMCFIMGVLAAYEELKKISQFNSRRCQLVNLCLRRVRETILRLSLDETMRLAAANYRLSMSLAKNNRMSAVCPFGKPNDKDEAITIIKKIIDSRELLNAYQDSDMPLEIRGDAALGLNLLFFSILKGSYQGGNIWNYFISAFTEGDSRACELMEGILLKQALLGGTNFAGVYTMRSNDKTHILHSGLKYPEWATCLDGNPDTAITIPVPDEIWDQFQGVLGKWKSEEDGRHKEIENVISWFESHRDEFSFLTKEMWEDISKRPRYGLRSNGQDKVNLDIPGCTHCQAFKDIQFYPGNFPATEVEVWGLWKNKYPNLVKINLEPENDIKIYNDNPRRMDMFLRFICLQCYWEIVMAKSDNAKPNGGRSGDSHKIIIREKLQHVRPFFRKLPQGFNHSGEALHKAREVLGISIMPTGMTFVSEHDRGITDDADSVPPLFTYSVQDIKSWI